MFKNSKKQGDAGLGQAIAYFTMLGYDIALPLTDSADWDLIVEMDEDASQWSELEDQETVDQSFKDLNAKFFVL